VDKIGANIKSIKRIGKEDLLLTMEGENRASILKQELQKKNIPNLEVSIKSNETTLLLYGVDPTVGEDTIKTAISKETGIKTMEIEVRNLRPGRSGNQNATVRLPRESVRNIIKNRKMQIGWTYCQVREKVPILRCYKCLELGHRAYQCLNKETNRIKDCLNCGETGHSVKECNRNSYCSKCQVEGHRFDQMKCPTFRKLVLETRERWANKK